MSEKETMELRILRFLAQGHSLTALEALDRFQCLSLSQRVGSLKRQGWPINSRRIKTKSGKSISCYELNRNQEQVRA